MIIVIIIIITIVILIAVNSYNTNVMLLGQVFTLKLCFLLSPSTQLLKKSLELNMLFKLQSPIL